uniref:arsenate reductase family protein n=1 Tax=Roseivirga sp. TaxID=1964215 RepID=UPI0040472D7F
MKKVYYLSTCSTCKRIMDGLDLEGFELQDIKSEPITEAQVDEMQHLAGSYEVLFSRKAMKFRAQGLHEMELNEADYRKYILEEYTFLKRPVFIIEDQIFIGNAKKTVVEVAEALAS